MRSIPGISPGPTAPAAAPRRAPGNSATCLCNHCGAVAAGSVAGGSSEGQRRAASGERRAAGGEWQACAIRILAMADGSGGERFRKAVGGPTRPAGTPRRVPEERLQPLGAFSRLVHPLPTHTLPFGPYVAVDPAVQFLAYPLRVLSRCRPARRVREARNNEVRHQGTRTSGHEGTKLRLPSPPGRRVASHPVSPAPSMFPSRSARPVASTTWINTSTSVRSFKNLLPCHGQEAGRGGEGKEGQCEDI